METTDIKTVYLKFLLHLFVYIVCVREHTCHNTFIWRSEDHCGNWFSPSDMWGSRMEFGVSDQAADMTHSPAELSCSRQLHF